MTDRMQEIGDRLEAAACVYPATIDGHAALFNAIGERDEHAADDLVFLWERCASLEAAVLELAANLRHIMTMTNADDPESYRNDDLEGCLETVSAVSCLALSHPVVEPIVSELTGEKGGGE